MKYLLVLIVGFTLLAQASQKPDHIVVMVFDQMRADYIQKFDLKNFKRLQKMGRNYKNAYVGHLASVTIVSHAVLSTGLLPKSLPWADNGMWDKEGALGKKDSLYAANNFNVAQVIEGLKSVPKNNFLANDIHAKWNKKVFAVGEKNYAAAAFGGPYADSVITLKKEKGVCQPDGVDIPSYVIENKAYTLDCHTKFGTDRSFYALDGYHYFPGKDGKTVGGDKWTADIALEIMKNENWGALLLTFGGIDKFGHMLGEIDHDFVLGFDTPVHMREIAQFADAQLGRILDELKARNLLATTLLVATADHGGTSAAHFLGEDEPSIGKFENKQDEHRPFWIERLNKSAKIRMAYADTGLRVWLNDDSEENHKSALTALKEIPEVTRIFKKVPKGGEFEYSEVYSQLTKQSASFVKWAKTHDLELANTMASAKGPDYVVNFNDQSGFGKLGEHGGSQEVVQRIPMIFAGPGVAKGVDSQPLRLFEVPAKIREQL